MRKARDLFVLNWKAGGLFENTPLLLLTCGALRPVTPLGTWTWSSWTGGRGSGVAVAGAPWTGTAAQEGSSPERLVSGARARRRVLEVAAEVEDDAALLGV